MLATFLALSQLDPQLRASLKKVQMPKSDKLNSSMTLDQILETTADNLIVSLSNQIIGGGVKGSDTGQVLDRLVEMMAVAKERDESVLEGKVQSYIDSGNKKISSIMSEGGAWLTNALTPAQAKTQTSDIQTLLLRGAQGIEALVTQDARKQATAVGMVSSVRNNASDKIPNFMKKQIDEFVGITDENRGMYGLMNPVKAGVSKIRQIFRQDMPKILAKQFSRKLTPAEWGHMHLMARADVAGLGSKPKDIKTTLDMLKDKSKLDLAIKEAEEQVRGLSKKVISAAYLEKAKELAKYMTSYEIDPDNHNLAKNADAIAHLAGSDMVQKSVDPKLVAAIDRLTTVYAMDMIDPAIKESLKSLAETETKGVEYILQYLSKLREDELAKVTTGVARANGLKGYIPSESKAGVELIVKDSADHNIMVHQGYTRLMDYEGSGFESGRKAYYYSTVGGHSVYHQGILQTVQNTAMGVDVNNGRSLTGMTGGKIDFGDVNVIKDKLKNGNVSVKKEALMPVYDSNYQVIGFERSLAPEMIQKMRKSDHLGEMIGAWAGRHVEEATAGEFNVKLVDELHKDWDEGRKSGQKSEFIDLSDKSQTSEIEQDAWNMIPRETKDMIKAKFEDDGFRVRRSNIDNAVGYRGLSIGEAWKGPSNMKPGTKKVIRDFAVAVRGKHAYRDLVVATKAIQAGVSVAKNIIVVLSVVVPVANAASNVQQLMTNGVGPRDIGTGRPISWIGFGLHA